jgi:hypothetical protein
LLAGKVKEEKQAQFVISNEQFRSSIGPLKSDFCRFPNAQGHRNCHMSQQRTGAPTHTSTQGVRIARRVSPHYLVASASTIGPFPHASSSPSVRNDALAFRTAAAHGDRLSPLKRCSCPRPPSCRLRRQQPLPRRGTNVPLLVPPPPLRRFGPRRQSGAAGL